MGDEGSREDAEGTALHVLIDGLVRKRLTQSILLSFLDHAVKAIDMQVIDGPTVYAVDQTLCAIVIIAESHISVHYTHAEVHIDCFSCRKFEASVIVELAKEDLSLYRYTMRKIIRLVSME